MSPRIRAAIAVACAACVGLAFSAYADDVRAEADRQRSEVIARYGGEVVDLVVTRHALEPGDVIEASDVEVREWLADLAPEGAITDADEVLGSTVTVPAVAGAPLTGLNFRDATEAEDVPEGYIAVSVPITDKLGLSAGTQVGSQVVAFRVTSDGAQVLATDAVVLSMPETASTGLAASGTLSIAVLPDDVADVLSASATDDLRIVLPAEGVDAIPDAGAPDEVESAGGSADATEGIGSEEGE
jgi:pilus assembly protein CpaB